MESKILLRIAFVLDAIYVLVFIGICSLQRQLIHLTATNLQVQSVFPVTDAIEMFILAVLVLIVGLLLGENFSEPGVKTEKVSLVLLAISLILYPVCFAVIQAATLVFYARTMGAEALAAYSAIHSYTGFANYIVNAAIILLMIHAAITYGAKKEDL